MVTTNDSLNQTASRYHGNAEAIPDLHIENAYQEYFCEWLLRQIPEKARVLEMGYGDGIVTRSLIDGEVDVTVIEGAASLAAIARERHSRLRVIHSMFETFAPSDPFDVVIASHVLEHVDNPLNVLRSIAPWLTDSGRLVVGVPNRNSIHRQLAVMMGLQPALDTLSKRDVVVGHQRVYSLAGVIQDICDAGFDVVNSAGFFLKVVPNSMMLGYSPDLLQALNAISPSLPKELLANLAVVAAKRRKSGSHERT